MTSDRSALPWRGRKIAIANATRTQLRLMASQREALILDLDAPIATLYSACSLARELGVPVWGWVEVARDPRAVSKHPEWMHLPQHHEWLEAFPNWSGDYKALVSPWVCVNNRETFAYMTEKVRRLVDSAPTLAGLFLNDIQGAPVGCGCGNVLCRSWDNSPGEKIAPTPYQNPEVFFSKVFWEACIEALDSEDYTRENVIPILCGECEIGVTIAGVESPDSTLGTCRGIPCSRPCAQVYWPNMVRAFAETQGGGRWKGILTPYKLFGRDVPLYGETAAWVGGSVAHYREFDNDANLIAVVQGWDVQAEEIGSQIDQATANGAKGILILEEPLDQSWEPVPVPNDYKATIPPIMCGHD